MNHVAGVDEAGRGPLAGPVVAAAVILHPDNPVEGLNDSKKLSEIKRRQLSKSIRANSLAWCISAATVQEIDQLNIHRATLLAMRRAVAGLSTLPRRIEVDGKFIPNVEMPANPIIKGDSKVQAISAASILAKQYRDQYMLWLDQQLPQYGFAKHKGYPTKMHRQALIEFGVSGAHRTSYAPVRELMG